MRPRAPYQHTCAYCEEGEKVGARDVLDAKRVHSVCNCLDYARLFACFGFRLNCPELHTCNSGCDRAIKYIQREMQRVDLAFVHSLPMVLTCHLRYH